MSRPYPNVPYAPSPRPRRHTTRLGLLVVLFIVVAGVYIALLERQNIQDWLALRSYSPPAAVMQLADQDGMTPYARKVFYVNHPRIDTKSAFAKVCPNGTEQTVVLGCYHSGQAGIYLLQVTDPRLSGVEQVTAAHETLHAIYDRLSNSKRRQVDGWLTDFYEHGLNDPAVKQQIASYRKTELHAVVNEMHSLFGTEVANLPAPLENYYKQYFTDRAAVVQDYDDYEGEFSSRQQQIKQDDTQLAALKSRIDANEADLKSRQAAIAAQQQTLTNERDSGDTSTYNAGVPAYNSLVDQYNAEVSTTQRLINQYNQLVDSRNALALEEQQLTQDLSSAPTPIKK